MLSVAEYLSVFLAIIVGLAVADLVTSLHKLIRARARVQWDWISLVLALVMLLQTLAFWWASFRWYQGADEMTIGRFLPDLVVALLLFLTVAAVLPDEVPPAGLSLRQHYLDNASYFWTLLILMGVVVTAWGTPSHMPDPTIEKVISEQWPNMVLAAGMLPLIFIKRIWPHVVLVILLLLYALWLYLPFLLR